MIPTFGAYPAPVGIGDCGFSAHRGTVAIMSAHRGLMRTWSGPVDASVAQVEALLVSGPVRVGGREHLERLERSHGRVLLRVVSPSLSVVTLSRQLSNRKVHASALFEDRYGPQLGAALRSLRSLGARESLLLRLGTVAAATGSTDSVLSGILSARHLVGGGVNGWVADMVRVARSEPARLLSLSLLVADSRPSGGVRPRSLESALRLASLVERSRRSALAAGALSGRHAPELQDVRGGSPHPAASLETFSGFELVLRPSSKVSELLSHMSVVLPGCRAEKVYGVDSVVASVPDISALPELTAAVSRAGSGLLAQESYGSLLDIGVPGAGVRFVWPMEFGVLPLTSEAELRMPDPGAASDSAVELRRQAEDRDVDMRALASQLMSSGTALSDMPANMMLRLLRMSEEGFMPGSPEWEALMTQAAAR